MGIFAAESIYDHLRTAHGTIHDDDPPVPVAPANIDIGIPIDIEEQRELFRQLEEGHIGGFQNALRVEDEVEN